MSSISNFIKSAELRLATDIHDIPVVVFPSLAFDFNFDARRPWFGLFFLLGTHSYGVQLSWIPT